MTQTQAYQQSLDKAFGDIDPELFEWLDGRTGQWIKSYLNRDHPYPLSPSSHMYPGEITRFFSIEPPQSGVPLEHMMEQFETLIVPSCMGWNSGNFMGYFGLGASSIAVIAQKLEAALNQTRMLWSTSPAATELEGVVLGWIKQLLGLPRDWFGMLHTNSRIDLAMIAALQARGLNVSARGLTGLPRFCCYASTEAHGSVEKAMVLVGLGKNSLRRIAVDDQYRMDVHALREAIEKDVQTGNQPLMVVSTIGTTSSTSIDPTQPIADMCEEYGLWLHVDGAYAALFAMDPQMRWVLSGCEHADSFTTNPHKPLFLPFDHSILFLKDPQLLSQAFQTDAAYLAHGGTPGAMDLYNMTNQIPHRFPALSLWMTLAAFGVDGIIARHRKQRELAQMVTEWVSLDPQMEQMAPTHFTVVCFRAHPQGLSGRELNMLNKRLMDAINARGTYFLSDTLLSGRLALRIAIGNIKTDEEAVRGLWQEITATLATLLEGTGAEVR